MSDTIGWRWWEFSTFGNDCNGILIFFKVVSSPVSTRIYRNYFGRLETRRSSKALAGLWRWVGKAEAQPSRLSGHDNACCDHYHFFNRPRYRWAKSALDTSSCLDSFFLVRTLWYLLSICRTVPGARAHFPTASPYAPRLCSRVPRGCFTSYRPTCGIAPDNLCPRLVVNTSR